MEEWLESLPALFLMFCLRETSCYFLFSLWWIAAALGGGCARAPDLQLLCCVLRATSPHVRVYVDVNTIIRGICWVQVENLWIFILNINNCLWRSQSPVFVVPLCFPFHLKYPPFLFVG